MRSAVERFPAYQTTTATYCLLEFAFAVKSQVWIILDGDSVILDRQGSVERFALQPAPGHYNWREWFLGDVEERGGVDRHRRLRLIVAGELVLLTLQNDGWGLKDLTWSVEDIRFARSPDQAPIVRLNRRLAIRQSLVTRGQIHTLLARVGTADGGVVAWVTPSIAEQIPARPMADVEWLEDRRCRQRHRFEMSFDC
jgi:hypothetical protein